jgi:catechol 2,3-dioxygenase
MNFHRPPNTYVGQVSLKVENLERAQLFYTDVIGFQILEQAGNSLLLTVDGQTPLLVIEQPENVIPKRPHTAGLYHFAILLPDRPSLASIVQHLVKKGYSFGSSDHLVSEALYLSDPDGNGIEFYADRSPSTWNWHEDQITMTVDPLDFDNLLATTKGSGSWESLPRGTVMGHIHLHVANLTEAEQFYRDGLGFDIVCRYVRQATFLSTGGYHHHVALNTWAGVGVPAPPANSVGLKYFTLEYPHEAARSKAVENLQGMGIILTEEQGNIQVKDPSGNLVQLNVSRL